MLVQAGYLQNQDLNSIWGKLARMIKYRGSVQHDDGFTPNN